MKWLKHMTCSGEDEKLSAVIDELGYEGYGVYWRLLEIVADKMESKGEPSCSYSLKRWANLFGFYPKKFEKFSKTFEKHSLIFCKTFEKHFENISKTSEKLLEISIPNLLKYQDKYTKKLQKTSANNNILNNTIKNKEKEKEYYCAEQKKSAQTQEKKAEQSEPPIAEIPLIDGTEYPITAAILTEFEKAYPNVDVVAQLRAIRAWCISNPTKRKTKNGVMRFINSWLGKEQDKGSYQPSHIPRQAISEAERRQMHNDEVCRQVSMELDAIGSPF